MLDRYSSTSVRNTYESPSEIKITEKRAPTDESIKLFDQYQEKAKEYLINSVAIKDNKLEALVFYYTNPLDRLSIDVHIRFNLNGEEYLCKHVMTHEEYHEIARAADEGVKHGFAKNAIRFIASKMAPIIAEQLIIQLDGVMYYGHDNKEVNIFKRQI